MRTLFIAIFLTLVQRNSLDLSIYNYVATVTITSLLNNEEKWHFSKRQGTATKWFPFSQILVSVRFFSLDAVLYVLE